MTDLHPTFAVRDAALREYCDALGWIIGETSSCRSLNVQIRLYNEKPHLAANPYARGPVSPWGWRSRGSLHTEQVDSFCHAIDYTIRAKIGFEEPRWSQFHSIAKGFGIVFPLADRDQYPEPWHGQTWTAAGLFPAPMLDRLVPINLPLPKPPPRPNPPKPRFREDADMYEFLPDPRPNDPFTLDFTWLPSDGQAFNLLVSCKLYVRRGVGGGPPDHVEIWMGGDRAGPENGADDNGLYYLPEDGQPIELAVWKPGLVSVMGKGARPVASAQYASWFVG